MAKIKDKAALAEIERLKAELETAKKANERVKDLEAKLTLIEEAVERSLKSGKLAKASDRTTVSSPTLPTDIFVDPKDKLNTQPTNGIKKGFFGNSVIFGKDMFRTLFKSKLFWSLLVVLVLIFSLMYYSVFVMIGAAKLTLVFNNSGLSRFNYQASGFMGLSLDFINMFVFMPMLLCSLIIFPSYIAKSREDNTLKRQAMIGITRKQTYYYYTFFSILAVVLISLFWFGPWTFVMDIFVRNAFSNTDPISANWSGTINTVEINLGWGDNISGLFNSWDSDAGLISNIENLNLDEIKDSEQFGNLLLGLKALTDATGGSLASFGTSDIEQFAELASAANENYINLLGDGYNNLIFPPKLEILAIFENWEIMLVMIILTLVALNNYGYKKAMKSKSSSGMLGWGIGMWIFSSFSSSGSMLLGINVIESTWSTAPFWNYLLMAIMFIAKWMFIVTIPSLLMSAVTISGTGIVSYADMRMEPGDSDAFVFFSNDVVHWMQVAIIGIAILVSILVILTTMFNKTRLMSYESSR